MRRDMNKVLITRPRHGGKGGRDHVFDQKNRCRERRYFKGVEVDTSPKWESMRKRHICGGDPKNFSDHLAPLQRYLAAQAGRPWDEVWSDICKVLKGSGLQAQHVKQHVKLEVGGIPHSGETYFPADAWHKPRSGYRQYYVYVDEEGILREAPSHKPAWKKRPTKLYDWVRGENGTEYHKINGCWFRIHWEEETRRYYYSVGAYREYPVMIEHKRALNKKEAKRLDLENRRATTPPRRIY